MKYRYIYIPVCLFLLFSELLSGQTYTNSPYSRFGLGDLERIGFGRNAALGGISIGMRDPNYIDYINPASYAARDSMSFLFEFGLTGKSSKLATNDDLPNTVNDFNFSHLAIAFPISKKIGASFGIVPYSSMSYKISQQLREGDPDYDTSIGNINYLFSGTGGIHHFFMGTAYKIGKNLSLGVNLSYLFGAIDRNRSITFLDSINLQIRPGIFSTRISEKTIVGDLNLNFGIQYTAFIKNDLEFTIGGIFDYESKINAESDIYKENILSIAGGGMVKDTLEYTSGVKKNIRLPQNMGVGFTFQKGKTFLIGADYYSQNWSEALFLGKTDSLVNSHSLHFGMEFTPKPNALRNYFNWIHYRIGGHYTNTYLQVNGEQLKDFGISFGLGIPISTIRPDLQTKMKRSTFNFAVELGQRGTYDNNLIKEKYAILSFSLTLYDFWFIKRKFD